MGWLATREMTSASVSGANRDRLQFDRLWRLLLVWISAYCLALGSASAATINVNQTSDVVNGDTSSVANLISSDGGDGISLREAIIATNNSSGADIINLATGTYTLAIAGDNEDVALTGDLDISDILSIIGAGAATTIVDANLLDRAFDVTAVVAVTLSGLTVRDGDIDKPGGGIQSVGDLSLSSVDVVNNAGKEGGGIAILPGGSLSISGGQINGNTAEKGAGVWIDSASSGTTINSATLDGNIASDNGGAIYVEAAALTVTNSSLLNNNAKNGAGIHFEKGNALTVSGCQISNNTASESGGGIWVKEPTAATSLTNVTMNNNDASKKGGGIYMEKGVSLDVTGGQINNSDASEEGAGVYINETVSGASFTSVTLDGNVSLRSGGAIYFENSALDVDSSTLSGNDARDGGGIYGDKVDDFSIADSVLSNNDASEDGGGLWLKEANTTTAIISRVTFAGNTAVDLGGAIYNDKSAFDVSIVTFSGNSADEGGGLYNKGGSETQSFINVTFSGNSATTSGGGIMAKDGNLDLTNVTLTANTAGSGSGIDADGGTTSLLNTLVAGNTGSADVNNTVNSLGNNLIGNSSGSSGWVGSDVLDVLPTLAALANNGGPTQTHALLQGSRGINEGNNSGAPANDQTGQARDATVDIGAYEYPGTPSFTIDKVVDIATVSTLTTLTFTITVDNDGDVDLTSPTLTDTLTQNGSNLVLTSGPTLAGDSDSDGQVDTDEIWVYTATYDVTQTNLDDGNDLVNSADFDTAETASASDSATTTITRNPFLEVTKTVDDDTDTDAGQVLTYTYVVENTGNLTITNVWLNDIHNGSGPAPTPTNETLTTDNLPLSDSTDGGINGIWDTIAPGDTVTFTGTYTVTQSDVDTLQ